ncbi:MAG: DNA repair protein RecN, partial [Chloroflexota bacterium]|nr:DNA repair protein RecN [Chloroflexota bacterium]
KSIIVDAIGLLLGKRAEEGLIRAEARQARVEGLFALSTEEAEAAREVLEEAGLPADDAEEIVVVREINHEGRNVCRVNGAIVPLRVLAALGERLVDIHGQNQQLPLLNVRTQLAILDRFAGLEPQAAEVADAVGWLRAARQELAGLRTDERELARRADLLRFQADEIASARLNPGEDEQIEAERAIVANAERLQALAAQAYDALYEGDDRAAAVDSLSTAAQAVAGLAHVDPSVDSLRQDAESLVIQAQELARSLQSYRDGVDADPVRLQEIEDRLEVIRGLKRKYGSTIEEVIRFGEEAAAELDGIAHSGERAEALEAEERELLATIGTRSAELSLLRRDAAGRLSAAVQAELADLAMESTTFHVNVTQQPAEDGAPVSWPDSSEGAYSFDATGIDRIEFLLSPGPGEPLRSLAATASGGETSRLMLAIKGVLAADAGPPTLIFDEVDAGIGGRVGAVVGVKTWQLSAGRQVLCVTHLPQIAAFADLHLRIAKGVSAGRTITTAEALSSQTVVEELAHMLGGASLASRQHAQEMLERTTQWKGGDGSPGQLSLEGLAAGLEVDTSGASG